MLKLFVRWVDRHGERNSVNKEVATLGELLVDWVGPDLQLSWHGTEARYHIVDARLIGYYSFWGPLLKARMFMA